MTVNIKFKKLHKDATIPCRAHDTDGGWDVSATEIIKESNEFVICKLGFAIEIPKGYKLTLVPRSSLTKTRWIMQNSPGLGDASYRGEYQYRFRAIPTGVAKVYNCTGDMNLTFVYDEFPFKVGDKIGQVYLEEVIDVTFDETDELDDTDRGIGGFGSSGR